MNITHIHQPPTTIAPSTFHHLPFGIHTIDFTFTLTVMLNYIFNFWFFSYESKRRASFSILLHFNYGLCALCSVLNAVSCPSSCSVHAAFLPIQPFFFLVPMPVVIFTIAIYFRKKRFLLWTYEFKYVNDTSKMRKKNNREREAAATEQRKKERKNNVKLSMIVNISGFCEIYRNMNVECWIWYVRYGIRVYIPHFVLTMIKR